MFALLTSGRAAAPPAICAPVAASPAASAPEQAAATSRTASPQSASGQAAAAAQAPKGTVAALQRWKINDERVDLTVTQCFTPRKHPHLAAAQADWESGTLHITNYRLIFLAHWGEVFYDIPLLKLIDVAKLGGRGQSASDPFSYGLRLGFKDCCTILTAFPPLDGSRKRVYEHLAQFPTASQPRTEQNWAEGFFCFPKPPQGGGGGGALTPQCGTPSSRTPNGSNADERRGVFNGWDLFNPHAAFRRQGALDRGWRVSQVNANFAMCSSYPEEICVPAHISDDVVKECSAFRTRRRIPMLSYFHAETGAGLVRSAQPTTGMGILGNGTKQTPDNADLLMVRAIASLSGGGGGKFEIIDLRAWVSAGAQKLQGGGYEDELVYGTTVTFAGLENIHYVRDAYRRMRELCTDPVPKKWFSALDDSSWPAYIALINETATRVVKSLSEGTSLLLHCTDGWDRTAQVVSVAQVLLDPYCRTFEGFAALVEREWVQSGHNFRNRCGYGFNPSTDESPIFLQFLDALYQVMAQHPFAFEFGPSLLLFLADSLNSGRFGTFLVNSPSEIQQLGFRAHTQSVWTYVLRHTRRFRNHGYEAVAGAIEVDIRPPCRRVWREYFLRYAGGGAIAPACCSKREPSMMALAGQPHSAHSHGTRHSSSPAQPPPLVSVSSDVPSTAVPIVAQQQPRDGVPPGSLSQPISLAQMVCLEEEDNHNGVEGASFSSTSSLHHSMLHPHMASAGYGGGPQRSMIAMQEDYEREIHKLVRERTALAREVNRLRETIRQSSGTLNIPAPPQTPRETALSLGVHNASIVSTSTHTPRHSHSGTPTAAPLATAHPHHTDPAVSDYDYEEDSAFDQFWLIDHYEADEGSGACVSGTAHCGQETRRSELVPIPQSSSVHT
eukprot:TRINITY_DN10832_c0_g2_i2.p1 TRINITY_DN10832_c0_g2~~TRINITY_DN10832_c0_g2_i2.p1  ORF type:complete len:895 (+),score=263.79 TRINITY_DN10832_c0_g2_i2:195-2879(+)